MTPGRYLVRDERGRLAGVIVVLEHTGGVVPAQVASMWTVANAFALGHGAPPPPMPTPDPPGSLVRWAGSTTRWSATDVELRRLGVSEPATWP